MLSKRCFLSFNTQFINGLWVTAEMLYRSAVLDEVWSKGTVNKDEMILNRIAFNV